MRKLKIGIGGLGIFCCAALLLAAIPGFFTTVNAITGYTLNGAAGSTGQALCSDGTYFDTPCNVGVAAVGTPGTYAYPSSVTTNSLGQVTAITASAGFTSGNNSNGYWRKAPDGFLVQGLNCVLVSSPTTITFPVAFTNTASVVVTMTECYNSGNPDVFPNMTYGSLTTTTFQANNSGSSTQYVNWQASGF